MKRLKRREDYKALRYRNPTAALLRLAEADAHVRRQSPDWSGDNRDHDGITAYSLAEWFRSRRCITPTLAKGRIVNGEAVVVLWKPPDDAVTFTGFAWGYGGEGPTGLAVVLTDASFFDDLDEAYQWVAHQDHEQPWKLQR